MRLAPFDVVPGPGQSYQPDVLVARRVDVGDRRMVVAPLLVVDVLSPGTKIFDLTTKRAVYARIGVRRLWYVDPELPSFTALVLDGHTYFDVATAKGDEELSVSEPFPVTIVPSELLTE